MTGMDHKPTHTYSVVVPPNLTRDEIGALADQTVEKLAEREHDEVRLDVSGVDVPDVAYMDALARVHLAARRHSTRVHLVGPCQRLLELIRLVGLDGILLDDDGSS